MHNASPARAAPTLAAPAADEAVIRRFQAEGYSDCTPTANINQCKLLGFSDGSVIRCIYLDPGPHLF